MRPLDPGNSLQGQSTERKAEGISLHRASLALRLTPHSEKPHNYTPILPFSYCSLHFFQPTFLICSLYSLPLSLYLPLALYLLTSFSFQSKPSHRLLTSFSLFICIAFCFLTCLLISNSSLSVWHVHHKLFLPNNPLYLNPSTQLFFFLYILYMYYISPSLSFCFSSMFWPFILCCKFMCKALLILIMFS